MQLQGRDLKREMTGEDVKLLQAELAQLGLRVSDDEAKRTFFGPTTFDVVQHFQKDHRLSVTGVVDAETARAINAAVDALHPPVNQPPVTQPPVVQPPIVVQPPVTQPPVEPPIVVRPPAADYVVSGTVFSPDHVGLASLTVVILDKNVGGKDGANGDVRLADTKTDQQGHYSIGFSGASLLDRKKPQPDLQAQVFNDTQLLASSDVHYNGGIHEVLNLDLPPNAAVPTSEHEVLTTTLQPLLPGALRDLHEDDKQQDLTYLANKTGWDARAVALASLADQFSQNRPAGADTGIDPAFYYALFRAGLPANPDTLYQTSVETVQGVWKQAVASGIIASNLQNDIPRATQEFQDLSASHSLDVRPLRGTSTLKELLTLSLGSDANRQQQFSQLYSQANGDMGKFWTSVTNAFGDATSKRLQLDGQLAYLTLNNAPLVGKLHSAEANAPIASTADLARKGYFRAAKWTPLLDANIPDQIPGANVGEKSANYAEMMAAQVRVSHPTAVVAEMVRADDLPVAASNDVRQFLTANDGKFELGVHPVELFVSRNNLQVSDAVKDQVKLLQRVYQISPSDQAMQGLIKNGLHSAYQISHFDQESFISTYKDDLGGAEPARRTYLKAMQVHNSVLNIATSYITAQTAPLMGTSNNPVFNAPSANPNVADIIAYSTLEKLFGSMDYCTCDDCRSVLSPAAYLVDLLLFTDNPNLPAGSRPQDVLFARRPDIQHLPLTCENTNIALPYIDLVNETLEYFVTNQLKLDHYDGHNTDGTTTSAELLASPEFVNDAAYETLSTALFPPPLPFHRPLETLRRHFDKFETPLQEAMTKLRATDVIERANDTSYGWRDILMEQLKLSRAEYRLLTDSSISLVELYGYAPATAESTVRNELANLQTLTRRLDISPEDLVEILKTRFVNPASSLIPRLQRLALKASAIKDFKDGVMTSDQLRALLPAKLRGVDYGGRVSDRDQDAYPSVEAWLRNQANFDRIMGLITISNPTNPDEFCSLDKMELRHLNPDNNANRLSSFDFRRLLRFIRLWKKLGLSIALTDRAITALYPAAEQPTGAGDQADLDHLDAGFLELLPRIGIVFEVMQRLNLQAKRDLISLIACWSDIDTHGDDSLYKKLFLSASLLAQDDVFADDGFGNYLIRGGQKLLAHSQALRSALTLSEDDLSQIVSALHFDANTDLTLANVSAVYRWGWLARRLRLSQVEFRLLSSFSGLDPFAPPDPANPSVTRFIELVQALKDAGLKPVQALYLIWNQDVSGNSVPKDSVVSDFARVLRADFAAVQNDFRVVDDPNGDVARARLALVYGNDVVDFCFGLLSETLKTQAPYSQAAPQLPQALFDASVGDSGKARLAYDDFLKLLLYDGVLTAAKRDALKAGQPADLQTALDALFAAGQAAIQPFFDRFPGLRAPFESYADDARTAPEKRQTLLEALLPQLKQIRKHQQALSAITAAARSDPTFADALLNDASVLHSATDATQPAVEDLVALETAGLSAQFFFRDTATGAVDLTREEPGLSYSADAASAHLPANGAAAGNPISGIWTGYLEAPQSDAFNLTISTDAGATVHLSIDGADVPLDQNGTLFSNHNAVELTGGKLYGFSLTVERVANNLSVQWQTAVMARQVIPPANLYSATMVSRLRTLYVTFLKATSLAKALKLTASETASLGSLAELAVGGQLWLDVLPSQGDPNAATAQALREVLLRLLDYAHVKAALSTGDERVLAVIKDPDAKLDNGTGALTALTNWDDTSLATLLAHFGKTRADLEQIATFRRVYDAFLVLKALAVPADVLIAAAINEPTADALAALQSALRARYDVDAWLDVIKPINDEMRGLQRDALVAYILEQFSHADAMAHIDTADKLFEFFLMDVQMEPCMETSRIRHTLSSVQLFIERCLLNLEVGVSPDALNASRWEWMKRYRVWEANRKVFLWPENWLEPELRDNQSSFFKETMSELLQKDITEDNAAEALLNYLSKLQEVAKLEPCGIYYQENQSPGLEDDVAHVVARTTGAHRKYYYRRRDPSGWTPWEQIKLDIEDNPVSPIVWQGRLFLFWLRLIKQTPQDGNGTPDDGSNSQTKVPDLNMAAMKSDARSDAFSSSAVTIQAVLHWSEYYNGKWQPPKTSDVTNPLNVTSGNGPFFDRAQLKMNFTEVAQPLSDAKALRVNVQYYNAGDFFLLHNTHSLPLIGVRSDTLAPEGGGIIVTKRFTDTDARQILYRRGTLIVDYYSLGNKSNIERAVLFDPIPFDIVEPRHQLNYAWVAPFFLHDSRHVFYVSSAYKLVTVSEFAGFGTATRPPKASVDIPGILQKAKGLAKVIRREPVSPEPRPGVVDPIEKFVSKDVNINVAFGNVTAVQFNGREIGAIGGLANDADLANLALGRQ